MYTKAPYYYLVIKEMANTVVYPVIGPKGEVYCAFDIEEARRHKMFKIMHSEMEVPWIIRKHLTGCHS